METVDVVEAGIPGPAGTITPAAEAALAEGQTVLGQTRTALADTRTARDQAQAYSATSAALQNDAVALIVGGNGTGRKALEQSFASRKRRELSVTGSGTKLKGRTNGLRRTSRGKELDMFDAAQEWWCAPVTTQIGRMTYGLHYSSTGEIIAWDRHDRDGIHSVTIGSAGAAGPGGRVDDHDAGARLMLDDASMSVAVWQNHGDDEYLRVRVSYDGTADGFMDSDEVAVSVAPGVQVSYNQIAIFSASATSVVLWVQVRVGPAWGWKIITIDRTARSVTAGSFLRGIQISGQQPYGMQVVDGRTLRIVYYVNPAYSIHRIWMLEVNMDSRTVVNARNNVIIGNLNDNAYIELTDQTPFVPETASTSSRRMFYPHPTARRVLFADWVKAGTGPDEAVYREAILYNGNVVYRDLGVAGPRNGYTADANYIAGACYSPDGSIVITGHNTAQGGEIRAHSISMSWVTALTDHAVSRPLFVQGGNGDEITWLAVDYYADYNDWAISLMSQVGLPVITVVNIVADHPLDTGDTFFLYEPGYSSWRYDPWVGTPDKVKNLADGRDLAVAYPTGSGAKVARTVKGALLFEGSTASTSNQSLTIADQQALDYMAANPGHQFFLAISYRINRAPNAGYVPAVGHRMVGAITGSADLATLRVGPTRAVVSGFKNSGQVATRQDGTTATGGPQLAMALVDGFTGALGSSSAMVVMHNGGSGSPAPSRVDYFVKVEDLTTTGRSYATAAAEAQAYHNAVHGTGGTYAGDSWT